MSREDEIKADIARLENELSGIQHESTALIRICGKKVQVIDIKKVGKKNCWSYNKFTKHSDYVPRVHYVDVVEEV